MIKEKKLREYIEPEMRIKRIDFSDILTNSLTNGPEDPTQGVGTDNLPNPGDPGQGGWGPE